MSAKNTASDGQTRSLAAKIITQLAGVKLADIDGKMIQEAIRDDDFIDKFVLFINSGCKVFMMFVSSLFSHLDVRFTIPALEGLWKIKESKINPFSWVSDSFKDWGLYDYLEGPTVRTQGTILRLRKNCTFQAMYGEIVKDVPHLFWDLRQIWEFVKIHPKRLENGGPSNSFFVRKVTQREYKIFVVNVQRYEDGYHAFLFKLEDPQGWDAVLRHLIFIPQ